jgi:peroxiredoxin
MTNESIMKYKLPLFSLLLLIFLFTGSTAQGFNPLSLDSSIGQEAPGFILNDLAGKKISLESFIGRPVLLNFWATWCPYCRKERSHLNDLHRKYKDKGLVILSISTDRSLNKLQQYMEKTPADFIVLSDSEGSVSSSYNIMGLPSSLLIDRQGIIKFKFTGFREWNSKGSIELIDSLF